MNIKSFAKLFVIPILLQITETTIEGLRGSLPLPLFLLRGPPSGQMNNDRAGATDEDAGADQGRQDSDPEPRIAFHEETRQDPAEHRPDCAQQDIADHAMTRVFHHFAGEPAGNQADDEPGYYAAWVRKKHVHFSLIKKPT
jgi:hypothetical protein